MSRPDVPPSAAGNAVTGPPRRPVTLWRVLLCFVFPAYPLFLLARWGWRLASEVFKPKHQYLRDGSPVLDWLQTLRVITGTVIVVSAFVYFDPDDGLNLYQDQLGQRIVLTALVGGGVLVAGLVLLYVVTEPHERAEVRKRLGSPASALVMTAGTAAMAWFVTTRLPIVPDAGLGWQLLAALGQFVIGGVLVGFWLGTAYLIGRHLFNASDVHPMLPSLLAPAVAWVLAFVELTGPTPLPANVQLLMVIGGGAAVTVLSLVELAYLRRKGFGLRQPPARLEPAA